MMSTIMFVCLHVSFIVAIAVKWIDLITMCHSFVFHLIAYIIINQSKVVSLIIAHRQCTWWNTKNSWMSLPISYWSGSTQKTMVTNVKIVDYEYVHAAAIIRQKSTKSFLSGLKISNTNYTTGSRNKR